MNDIIILGIETSCDETAASVVRNGREIQSNIVYSQEALHKRYGGVVPEIASRSHLEKIGVCVDSALHNAGVCLKDIDAIAVTYTPGLVGALLVGVGYAKGLAFATKKPLIGINHIEGHICANYLGNTELEPPFLCLVASGGHTSLYLIRSYILYEQIGQTLDDAAGEAFDKTARSLGLPYPGGKHLEENAKNGNPKAVHFPRPINQIDNFNFSFSGLKSAALNHIKHGRDSLVDIAASFQEAVTEVLASKTVAAAKKSGISTIALAGGVSSNSALRAKIAESCSKNGMRLFMPQAAYCTDNAAMIAARGFYAYINNDFSGYDLNAKSR